MKRKFLLVIFFAGVFLLLSGVLMYLWNTILPPITHLSKINYWQALGLMVLCRILFGRFNFGKFGGRREGDPPGFFKNKLMGMDEKDREAFKQEWRRRCDRREKE